MVNQLQKLAADQSLGTLETIAQFEGAMPTGVTVSHQGAYLCQFPNLLWPDTMSVATDGYLYVTANQLHRQKKYQNGSDRRQKPYSLFRIRIDAQPVLLRKPLTYKRL